MTKLFFVTQNAYKFQSFQSAIAETGMQVEQLPLSTPEIQASANSAVAEFSAQWASQQAQKAVICEDVGLYLDAYTGFPGPYLADIEKSFKTEGFLTLLSGNKNRGATWEYAVAYCEPNQQPVSFTTHVSGTIASEARGVSGWYVDKLFVPEGETRTIAELLDAGVYQRNHDHYTQLFSFLASKTK